MAVRLEPGTPVDAIRSTRKVSWSKWVTRGEHYQGFSDFSFTAMYDPVGGGFVYWGIYF